MTKVDATCWDRLRERIPIPQRMPSLPVTSLTSGRKRMHTQTLEKSSAQRVITLDNEEPEIIKAKKNTTPPKRTPVARTPDIVSEENSQSSRSSIYPTPFQGLRIQKLLQETKCKRSQRNELKKITTSIDLEIIAMNQHLTSLQDRTPQ